MQSVAQPPASHNGTYPPPASEYTAVTPHPERPKWHDREPVYVHSLRWHDPDTGIEHLTVIRSDTETDLFARVKTVAALVKHVRERHDKASPAPAAEAPAQTPPEGWCAVHQAQMKSRHNATGSWWSHKTADGWCRGT